MKRFRMNVFKTLVVVFLFIPLLTSGQGNSNSEQAKFFLLVFSGDEYNSRIGEVLEKFFKDYLRPQDQLSVVTPVKTYAFSTKTREEISFDRLIDLGNNVLKRDLTVGMSALNQSQDRMIQLIYSISSKNPNVDFSVTNLKNVLNEYRSLLDSLYQTIKFPTETFQQFVQTIKEKNYQAVVFYFQEEILRAIPDDDTMNRLRESSDLRFIAAELFAQDRDEKELNPEGIVNSFKEVGLQFNFVFIPGQNAPRRDGVKFRDSCAPIFNILSAMARATGGIVETSSRPSKVIAKYFKTK